jgi:flavorubredoxin
VRRARNGHGAILRFNMRELILPNVSSLLQVSDLPYETIANGHGPMLRFNMRELVDDYQSWSENLGKAAASVAVLYSDSYGFCDRLSQTLAKGITKAGVATEMVDLARARGTLVILNTTAACVGPSLRRAAKRRG